ncbi:oligopeptidase B [Trypanosoma cruzi Dm28c]|uniref:Prolyl endopeptidase n=2 Tax=Trypanosoma cruzi TaxID=5693 RepID=V5BJF9_TRYCR|nr:oligopeptidase B [Trypanosoma cruzi Dm28c]
MLPSVYGSYGVCCDVVFENERLSLLDCGFVWGFAAVCGGSELGAAWRKTGCGLQRATSVKDFVSVSFYVQETGWCAAGQLVTHGSSAGVFVATAAMCVAPSLPLAVIALVPCVDCLTTLMDDILPLTVSNWEEFGNPRDDADAYRLLLLTAWHDTRVGFWESLAFTARLRAREMEEGAATRWRVLLHHCEFGAGHNGSSGRYDRLRETAREYAFALLIQQSKGTFRADA